MNYKDLNIEIRYRSNIHNIPKDFYIPVLNRTVTYKRASGYFSTTALVKITTGLFSMALKPNSKIQIICSPELSQEDIEAVNKGYKKREEVISNALQKSFKDPTGLFEKDRLALVANLIASGMLDIKIAFMEDDKGFNIYHEKLAIFTDEEGNKIAYTGSMNESENGFDENFESFYTFCDWKGNSVQVMTAEADFDEMWNDKTHKIRVIPFPEIMVDKLMKYKRRSINHDTDKIQYAVDELLKVPSKFQIPERIKLRPYQETAISNWFDSDYKGVFSLCTGAGKTITALAAMAYLGRKYDDKLGVFIIVPYIHLASQWEEDILAWGWTPIICHSKSPNKKWEDSLKNAYRRFKNDGKPFICLTTNDTFTDEKIQQYVTRFNEDQNMLLIVDEAHNFGAPKQVQVMPYNIKHRIALSATIRRHGDPVGTAALFNYFGDECITYTLEDALRDKVLTPYEYYPILISLEPYELNRYIELTNKIKKCLVTDENGKYSLSTKGELLLFERTRLIAGAEEKTCKLLELMEDYKDDNNILVYCGATTIEDDSTGEIDRQVNIITDKLQRELHMSVQKFTAEEGLEERENIKTFFKTGQYQVITAIKCLDEGVNIPGIKTAFILASSRNPKEFIQRRGRLLRKSEGKEKAVIYDFISLPRPLDSIRPDDFENDASIVRGELVRMHEFSKLAENKYEAQKIIDDIMFAYGVYFDLEEFSKEMEETNE